MHAAKGLESKVVLVIGLTQSPGGFPDIWLDDRICHIIRPVKYDILLEEERRLFYVAFTRAADHLYLITEKGNESMFINEIPENTKSSVTHTIKAVLRNKKECKSCGHQAENHFKFCPACGEKV